MYDEIRGRLVEKGVPEGEIAFIHTANTETRKAELFAKVRSGQVRFLLGSTQKMGAGTNVQDWLIALHHLDVPWRPAEEERARRYIGKSIKWGIQLFRIKCYVIENHKGYQRYLVFWNRIHYNCIITNDRRHLWVIKQLMG